MSARQPPPGGQLVVASLCCGTHAIALVIRLSINMLKAKRYCIAAGCHNNDRNSDRSFFGLPSGNSEKATKRCLKWLTSLGREDLLEKKDLNKNSHRVCSAHFDISSMKTINILKDNAVPTLFLANQTQEDPSSRENSISTQFKDKNQVKVVSNKMVEKYTQTETTEEEALEKSTQTPISEKRKLSDELKECKSKQRRLNHEVVKIKHELHTTNNPITCNDPVDKITRLKKLIDWQNKLKNKYKENRHEAEYNFFALNLHYSIPHAYRCLQTVLKLPSKSTLNRLKIQIPATLDCRVLDSLALKIKSLPDSAKYCTISVDEMTLKKNLYYNITSDEVIGFHNVNGKTSPEIASNAFVIMLQSIYFKWEQPIAYALLATAKHYEEIDIWLNEVISKLSTIGIQVKAIVSASSNFDKFAKDINKVTLEKPYFIYEKKKIYYIFDVPHLLKCIRNNLLTSDFILKGKKISWEYITQLYNDQRDRNLRLVPKITEAHIHPNNFQKMRVSLAVQIMSRSVGAALHTYIDLGKFTEEARPTAAFIESMNNLFDVLNSNRIKCNNKFQEAFRRGSDQEIVLNGAKETFAALKAINRKTGKNNADAIKTFVNFQISIQSIIMLFEDLRNDGFEYLMTRRLNQDNLDIIFGCEPTPIQFQRAFSKLLVCTMMKNTPKTNCELDICDVLLKAENMIKMKVTCSNLTPHSECRNAISLAGETDYRMNLPDKNALIYVSAYLFFKCANKHNCPAIDKVLTSVPGLHETHLFSRYKTYNKRASFYDSLKMPPKEFIEFVKKLESVFTQNYEKLIQSNPGGKLLELFQSVPPQTPCSCFPVEYLIKLFARFRIFTTIKFNNRQFKHGKKGIKMYLKVSDL